MRSSAVAHQICSPPLLNRCVETCKSGRNDHIGVATKEPRLLVPCFIIALLLSACGTSQGYLGKARPDAEIATIKIDDSLLKNVSITSVDGDPFPSLSSGVTLLPGCHSLAVEVSHAGFYFPSYRGCATFSLPVEAGGTYLMQEHHASHISVSDVVTGRRIGGGSLRRIGVFAFCTESENASSAGCTPRDTMAGKQIRRLSNTCSDAKNPERPWEGYWQAAQHNATLTLVIDEKWVGGNFEVRGRKYPISGTVDDAGYVKAFYSNSPGPGGGTLAGTFPEIGIPDVGSAGMGRKLAMYQGKVFRLCE